MLFAKPNKAIGVDVGSHSVKTVQVSRSGGRLHLDSAGYALVDRNQYNVDPIVAQADAVREALRTMSPQQSLYVGALPAQTVVIRYPRLPDVSDSELAQAVEAEAGQNIPYELSEVFLDWTVLDRVDEGERATVKVLLVATKHEVIEARVQLADEAGIQYTVLGVDSLALADAAEGCDFLRVGESVALVNLGAGTTSIHFVKDGISNFIRDVNWGAREILQAIAKAYHCELGEAEKILGRAGAKSGHAGPEQPAEEPPPQPEEEGAALLEPLDDETQGFGEPPSTGGGSALGGSLLDPLDDELGGLDAGPAPAPAMGSAEPAPVERDLAEVLSMPLGRLVAEIRRSFDYYEQQLYEHPVDRLIISGGVAQVPVVRDILADELGVQVEVADPSNSALMLGPDHTVAPLLDRPAQFMVAVGLAVRGADEL